MWDLAQVLDTNPLIGCGDIDGCTVDQIAELAEFRLQPDISSGSPNIMDPTLIHQVRFEGKFCYAPSYEEGIRVLDISDPIAPVEIGFFDTVVPNTDGCAENGAPCGSGSANRMLNRGFFGVWGVASDECFLYLSERGSPDNNGGAGIVGEDGEMLILRYTGGPTTPQPLRITKNLLSAGDLFASWGEVPKATKFNAYRGTIDSLSLGRVYDHTVIDVSTGCNQPTTVVTLSQQFVVGSIGTDYYYLVTARSPCDERDGLEGNYGQDSLGNLRPPANAIPTCPTCTTCPL